MAEKGRPAASSGTEYQDVRVADSLIDLLLHTSIISVAVETVDPTDDLVVRTSSGNRYEQVKERAPNGGSWTAAAIVSEGVMDQFIRQLQADPNATLVLFTASSAAEFREVTERARNASANYGRKDSERVAAEAEWDQRLGTGLHDYVDQVFERVKRTHARENLTRTELFEVFVRVQVLDASGTIQQLRTRALERLTLTVDDPQRALIALEGLARGAAIRRGVINRPGVERKLQVDGAGPRFSAFAPAVDADTYAAALLDAAKAVDVAGLPPLEPILDLPPDSPFSRECIAGQTLLIGGHGAGKSRLASELAVKTIRAGRRCLHARLAAWATTLVDLLIAELSLASKRPVTPRDLNDYLGSSGAVVLDGLDEIPLAQRAIAEREIAQFARSCPQLSLLVTSRPASGAYLRGVFFSAALQPLSSEQIEAALNARLSDLDLPDAILALAGNPLMLGLLRQVLTSGGRPDSEANLLDQFVHEILTRQFSRDPLIDEVSGQWLAEDAAFEWLSFGRVALEHSQMRAIAASVSRHLRTTGVLETNAASVERWLVESGLAVIVGTSVIPIHRAVLDHLAGKALVRRGAVEAAGHPELREAAARYIGSEKAASESMLSLLTGVGDDLELLARGNHLVSRSIAWPFGPERFANEYLAELRRLASGPLVDVGVLGRPIRLELDREITWIREQHSAESDTVAIVDTPNRVYVSVHGSQPMPVERFQFGGHRGMEIRCRVPHFAALERVQDELISRVGSHTLSDEGPDIVYERLCRFAEQFIRTLTLVGPRELEGLAEHDFNRLTAAGLKSRFSRVVTQATGTNPSDATLPGVLIVFSPQLQRAAVGVGPEAAVDQPGTLGVHGSRLLRLLACAEKLGIENLPLHPLALLPSSANDSVLSLPGRYHDLRGEALSLYAVRRELGGIRAFRHLVEHNLRGLSPYLEEYQSLPWRVELRVEDLSNDATCDARLQFRKRRDAAIDEVAVVAEFSEEDRLWTGSKLIMPNYDTVLRDAYGMVEQDLRSLLSGRQALGSDVL